jgi:hypothetical protein
MSRAKPNHRNVMARLLFAKRNPSLSVCCGATSRGESCSIASISGASRTATSGKSGVGASSPRPGCSFWYFCCCSAGLALWQVSIAPRRRIARPLGPSFLTTIRAPDPVSRPRQVGMAARAFNSPPIGPTGPTIGEPMAAAMPPAPRVGWPVVRGCALPPPRRVAPLFGRLRRRSSSPHPSGR